MTIQPVAERELPVHEAGREEIRVECVTDPDSFVGLESVWDEVLRLARPDHPFLEHAWVRTWWECFGGGSALRILVVKAGGRPIAIAPLALTTVRMFGLRVRRLGFLYNAHVPRADFLIGERNAEVYRAIWSYLASSGEWDLLELCQLMEGSTTLGAISTMASSDGWSTGVWPSEASPYVPIDTSWDGYFGGLTAKHRSNLRNRFKRLGATGEVGVETVASGDDVTDALAMGLELEAAAWKGRAGTAISCDPRVLRFYSLMARRAAERGWLRLEFLRVGDARVAFDYSLSYRNRMHLLKVGYDPGYSAYSPSNLLLCRVLQRTFEEGLREYDFLGGDAEWKRVWASRMRRHYWLYVFSNGFKGRLLHQAKFRLTPLLRRDSMRVVRQWLIRLRLGRKDG